ncbi:MAG TPA: PhzF family phenazine biosynthesis protein [Actinomycetota bacterium]|nr:PhzF family phenazine biosynthesis protein [Actinomycetota bacterium]
MEVSFRLVDVFTEEPFAGNQLCVVPHAPEGLDTDAMQTLAQEIGFSETTFVTQSSGGGYRMRIFTPAQELQFAGHPTLGTAFVLVNEGRVASTCVQTTEAGNVPVMVDTRVGFAWMTQLPPAFSDEFSDRELLARAAGLEPNDLHPDLPAQVISTGLAPLLVPVRDEAALRRAERNGRACKEVAQLSSGECLYLFAVRGDGDVMARMFDPFFGIGEDPATGAAAGPLGAYLAARGVAGMPGRMVIAQGEMVGRPSFLHVDVSPNGDSWVVRVGGGVRIVGVGVFRL